MKFNKQSGQALVGSAVAMVVLCGFAGLAIDMGTLRYQKRLQQTAADSGALAGTSNLEFASGVVTGAQNASAQNGFTDNAGGQVSSCTDAAAAVGTICVQVNNPPLSGPHTSANDAANASKYVEVLVSEVQPTYFMQIFGVNKQVVTARAVATNVSGGANSGCLYTLGPPNSSIEGISINGAATLNAPTCGIADNGDYNTQGSALVVTAGTFGVSGSRSSTGSGGSVTCTSGQNPCPTTNVPASGDPLASVTPPSQPPNSASCPAVGACNVSTSGTMTLQPGTYNSIDIGKNSTVTMAPGIYYINGNGVGLNFNGGGTVTDLGNPGVMIYFTNGSTLNGRGGANQPDIQLSPMTSAQSAQYAGILFYQDPSDTTAPSLGGDNNSQFNGVLYFPKVQLTFFGNNTTYSTGLVVADSISLSGSPVVTLGSQTGLGGVGILTHPILVE